MAEKFGDTSLQELINVESMSGLNAYYEKFLEVLGDDAEMCSGPNSGLTLAELMRHLHHNVLGELGTKRVFWYFSEMLHVLMLESKISSNMRLLDF